MRRSLCFLSVALLGLASQLSFASQFDPISISQLEKTTTLIVIGRVSAVEEKSAQSHTGIQEAIIEIKGVLKGQTAQKRFSLTLNHKGLVGFDPQLKKDDLGVFFLKSLEKGVGHLSFYGSLATFPHGYNFRD